MFPTYFMASLNIPVLIWLVACTYCVIILFLTIGMFLLQKSEPEAIKDFPFISVIVSSRNEEKDLPDCINAIEKLDYPTEKLEVILINDRSDDKTDQIITDACQRNEHFYGFDTFDMETKLEAKARGLSRGFEEAKGEWVFVTDADASVHPKWIKACLSHATDEVGMVGGALLVKPDSLLAKFELVSWAFLQSFSFGFSGWGHAIACVGPNMAIRKELYDMAGGLENTNFSIAEDLALVKMVTDTGYKVQSYMDLESSAVLKSVPSFKNLLGQQKRWLRGGIETNALSKTMLYGGFTWLFFVMLYILLGWIFSPELYLLFIGIKFACDLLLLTVERIRLKTKKYVRYTILLELYQPIALIIVPLSYLFNRKAYWKGDGYEIVYK